jgi:hypothetical protein
MGVLTDQVINQWAQIANPDYWDPGNFIDTKSSFGKFAIKSEILTPSHTVSIAPLSYKVEVDPSVFSDQFTGLLETLSPYSPAFFQGIEIKQLLKLSLKGDKEVAFKTKSTVEYSANEDDESKTMAKIFVSLAVVTSALAAIASEVCAVHKWKDEQKFMWIGHAAFCRLLFAFFNYVVRANIQVELATEVKAAAARKKDEENAAAARALDQAIDAKVDPVRTIAQNAARDAVDAVQSANAAEINVDALTANVTGLGSFVLLHSLQTEARLQALSNSRKFLLKMARKHQDQIRGLRDDAKAAASGKSDGKNP